MDTLSDRVFVRKILARKGLGDDDHRRRAVSIVVIEIAALENRNAHRAEVMGACGEEVTRRFVFLRDRPSLNLKRDTEPLVTEWQRVYRARRLHARRCFQSPLEIDVELALLCVV